MPEAAAPPHAAPSRAMAQTTTPPASALGAGGVAGLSHEGSTTCSEVRTSTICSGSAARSMGASSRSWGRPTGARPFAMTGPPRPSPGWWSASGSRSPTARALTHVAEKAWDIPQLVGSLCAGEISFDKVRVLADVATPETDRELCDQAKECSVRELADIARSTAELARTRFSVLGPLRARWSLLALQRRAPHHQRPAAGRLLRRDQGPPSMRNWQADPLRRRDTLGPASL